MQITNLNPQIYTPSTPLVQATLSATDAPARAAPGSMPPQGGDRAAAYDYSNLARGDILSAIDKLYPEGAPLAARTFRIAYPGATFSATGGGVQTGPAGEKIDFVAHLRREAAALAQSSLADERRQANFVTDMLARIHGAQTTAGSRLDVRA